MVEENDLIQHFIKGLNLELKVKVKHLKLQENANTRTVAPMVQVSNRRLPDKT